MAIRFDTWVTRTLGIQYPVLVGGMMWLGRAELVAAIVRAGGTGFLSALTIPTPEKLKDEISRCRDLAESERFGVNLYISNHRDGGQELLPLIDVVCDMGVPFVETSGAKPDILIERLKQTDIKILHKVPTVRFAQSAERAGADAAILVGGECGGHPGAAMIGSFVQGALAPGSLGIPVILGGGVGHGSQLVAALAMGCAGVLMGTRMMVAEEAIPHPNMKQRIVGSDGTDTVIVQSVFNHHHRVMANETTAAVLELERLGETDFEAYRPHLSGEKAWQAIQSGDHSKGIVDMGQSACFANAVEPTGDIMARFIDEAEQARSTLTDAFQETPRQTDQGDKLGKQTMTRTWR